MTEALVVARKELLEIVRDRRSLFVLLLLPVLLYPVLIVGMMLATSAQMQKLTAERYQVWVEGEAALPAGLRARLAEVALARRGRRLGAGPAEGADPPKLLKLELSEPPAKADYDLALTERRVAAVIQGVADLRPADDATETLTVLYNGGVDSSNFVKEGILQAVDEWRRELVRDRLGRAGLPPTVLQPVATRTEDRGARGALLARMLSMLLVVLALTGAFYPALDLGVGEKERGTLETLLLAPVPRVTVAMGKFLAVFAVALACALLHLLSLGVTFSSFALLLPPGTPDIGIEIQPMVYPAMVLVLLPLVALFSALSLAVATFAASYKEGQAYLTPIVLVGMLPAMAAVLPGVELTVPLCLVPVLSAVLLMKGLLAQTAGLGHVLLVVASSLIYAGLAVRWVATLFEREEVLWRPAAASVGLLGFGGLFLRARRPEPEAPGAAGDL